MLLTIEEYISRYNDCADFLRSLAKPRPSGLPKQFLPQPAVGMIKWSDGDACNWAGPFDGNYAFLRITDHTHEYPRLPSVAELIEREKKYHKYSMFTWRTPSVCERVLGIERGGRSELSAIELRQLLAKAAPEDVQYYNHKLKESYEKLYWHLEMPSVEMPVLMYLCGNDDTSYSKLFESAEESLEYLAVLEVRNNFTRIHRDFRFTN